METASKTVPTDVVLPVVGAKRPGRRFFVNVMSLGSVQLANMLLPLFTVPYVVRIIGPERLGLLNFSQAYIAYFTLLINYGFEMSTVRTIAAAREDQTLVNRVFSEVMTGKVLLWTIGTAVFVVLTSTIPELREHFWLHCCTFLSCVGYVLFPLWLYQAMEELARVAVLNFAVKILFTFSVFFFIREADDYFFQNLILSVAQVAISIIALVGAFRRFNITFKVPTVKQMIRRFREDAALFYTSVTITLYSSSTVFILGLLSSAYSVGVFSAGVRLESIARSFVGVALNQAFFPIAAREFGRSRAAGIRTIQLVFLPLLILLVAISIGLWVVAPWFIAVFYGSAFAEATSLLRIVAVLTVTIGISNLLGFHTMINLRMDRAFLCIAAVGSILGVIVTIAMVHWRGHFGAASAWVIVESCIALAMFIYLRIRGVALASPRHLKRAFRLGRRWLNPRGNPTT